VHRGRKRDAKNKYREASIIYTKRCGGGGVGRIVAAIASRGGLDWVARPSRVLVAVSHRDELCLWFGWPRTTGMRVTSV
jgi:hypothetical protein